MCFAIDAEPPIAPLAGGAVDSEDMVLTSEDGTEFAAFAAHAAAPSSIGIVVLPDVRGLFHFYEELALRFAEIGMNAIAIDYFGRTAGVGKRDDAFPYMEHIPQTQPATIAQDVAAAVAYLRSPAGGSATSIFTIGFCFGGTASWMQTTQNHGLRGAIGFYGMPGDRGGAPGPQARLGDMKAPILAIMGGADQYLPREQIDAFGDAVRATGGDHEFVVYEGAPHSFFDRSAEEHAEASADAWRRVLDFIAKHSA